MKPGTYDFTVRRGGSTPLAIRLKTEDANGVRTPLDLAGSTFVLTVVWPEGSLRKSSADGGLTLDPANGEIVWQPVPAETRLIPEGRIAQYEWERRLPGGRQSIVLAGHLIGQGGINDD